MALNEKQRKMLQQKAAQEQADRRAREEEEVGQRRGRDRDAPRDGVPGPPPALVVLVILLCLIGGALALGYWLSSADDVSGGTALPADVGTSEDKGGYISDEGLPDRSADFGVTGNPAGNANMTPEEFAEAYPNGVPADGEDQAGDGETEGDADEGPHDDEVRVQIPGYMTAFNKEQAEQYAQANGWYGAEVETTETNGETVVSSIVYKMSAEQRDKARADRTSAIEDCIAGIAGTGVFTSIEHEDGDENMGSYRAYVADGYAEDPNSWGTAASDLMARSAEWQAFQGSNNPGVNVTVCRVDESGVEIPLGAIWYVNGGISVKAES